MLSEKFIGRVKTDLVLGPLYEELVRYAAWSIIGELFAKADPQQYPSFSKVIQEHRDTFWKKLAYFLSACKLARVRTPKKVSLRMFEEQLLRSMLLPRRS